MRYWTFDVCSLIADYKKNQRTLAAIKTELQSCRKMIEHPIGATSRGDWEQLESVLELRETEYEMYVDMVTLGLNDLPEVERLVLQWWLIDNMSNDYIIEHAGIESLGELKKIKRIALTKFTNITMPN